MRLSFLKMNCPFSSQVEDLRRALVRSEETKQKLLTQIEKQDEYIRSEKRRSSGILCNSTENLTSLYWFSSNVSCRSSSASEKERDSRESEVTRLKDEVNDLRHQLNKSAGALGEYGELRRELDRSEKQRLQLSDHIEVSVTSLINLISPSSLVSMYVCFRWTGAWKGHGGARASECEAHCAAAERHWEVQHDRTTARLTRNNRRWRQQVGHRYTTPTYRDDVTIVMCVCVCVCVCVQEIARNFETVRERDNITARVSTPTRDKRTATPRLEAQSAGHRPTVSELCFNVSWCLLLCDVTIPR